MWGPSLSDCGRTITSAITRESIPSANEAEIRYLEAAHAAEDAQSPGVVSGKVTGFFRYRSVWGMCCGWMFFNTVWYGLLTWMPNYLYKVHGLDIKQLGGASFIIFFSGFVGELVGGYLSDHWRARGGSPNAVYRTLFGVAAIVATVSIFAVSQVKDPVSGGRAALQHAVLPALVWPVLGRPFHSRDA